MSVMWGDVPLGDLVENLDRMRVPVSAPERQKRTGSVPYYGASGQVGTIDVPLFDEDLLLVGEDGVQFFDPHKTKAYRISGPSWVNNHAHVLRPNRDRVDDLFLLHYLNHFDYAGYANGTTRLKLTQAAMNRIPIPLPPLGVQRRIVSILEDHLSRLDVGMRGLESALVKSTQLLGSMRQQALLLASLDTPLADVASIQGGIQKQPKRMPQSNAAPFLRVANVTPLGLDLADVHQIELFAGEMERYRLEAGDLLVVEGNGSPTQIGRAAAWGGQIADCVHQNHLIRVRPSPRLNPKFLEIIWNAPSTRKRLTALSSSTSGLHTLSVAKLKAMPICVPDLEEQNRFVRGFETEVAKMDRLMLSVVAQRSLGSALRRSVLAAAFSGQLTNDGMELARV